jgi:hypothetical protein
LKLIVFNGSNTACKVKKYQNKKDNMLLCDAE